MRLAAATILAFVLGFAIMFARNARSVEHNAITGTGMPVPRRRVGPDRMLPNTGRGLASTPPTRN